VPPLLLLLLLQLMMRQTTLMLNASVPVLGRVPPSQQYKRHRRPYHEHHDIPASVIFIILSSLVVKDKDGRPPDELGASKSMECDISPSVL